MARTSCVSWCVVRSAEPSANGAQPSSPSPAPSTLSFYTDVNGNGVADQVVFFLSSTTLEQGVTVIPTGTSTYNVVNQTNKILINDVKNATSIGDFSLVFQTMTANASTSSPLAQPVTTGSVNLVRINLTVDADPNHSPLPITYVSDATLRNLKDNL